MAEGEGPAPPLAEVIPRAVFLENVQDYVKGVGAPHGRCPCRAVAPAAPDARCRRPRADRTVDEVLAELQEHHQKYKYVEQEITARKRRLTFKQPEIRKCLDAVELLLEQSERGEEVRPAPGPARRPPRWRAAPGPAASAACRCRHHRRPQALLPHA